MIAFGSTRRPCLLCTGSWNDGYTSSSVNGVLYGRLLISCIYRSVCGVVAFAQEGAATARLVFWLVCTSRGTLVSSFSVLPVITAHSILQIRQLRGLFPVVVSRLLVMYWVHTGLLKCCGGGFGRQDCRVLVGFVQLVFRGVNHDVVARTAG